VAGEGDLAQVQCVVQPGALTSTGLGVEAGEQTPGGADIGDPHRQEGGLGLLAVHGAGRDDRAVRELDRLVLARVFEHRHHVAVAGQVGGQAAVEEPGYFEAGREEHDREPATGSGQLGGKPKPAIRPSASTAREKTTGGPPVPGSTAASIDISVALTTRRKTRVE
jgi:general stress protein YciG